MEWDVLDLNGSTARTAVTRPSQACSIEVAWRAWWQYDSSAYCPGCVVQLYFGMSDDKNNNVFRVGVIERGIHGDHRGTSRVDFTAPAEPGVYYITQAITLAYHYARPHFPNHPNDSFAVIRVLPPGWNEMAFALLPRAWRARIRIVMLIQARARTAMSTGPVASGLVEAIAAAPVEVLFIIFGYFDAVSADSSNGSDASSTEKSK